MTKELELSDIQGNIVRAYGKANYPKARYFFLHIENAESGRKFVESVRHKITTAARWDKSAEMEGMPGGMPRVTLNIAFTFYGLLALQLPTRTLQAMPPEFIDGMKARAYILGDADPELSKEELESSATQYESSPLSDGKVATPNWLKKWDPIWRDSTRLGSNAVHVWMSMNAKTKVKMENGHPLLTEEPVDELEQQTQWLRDLCAEVGGVRIMTLDGKKGGPEYQEGSAIFEEIEGLGAVPLPHEHFGFADGIGDPVFEGQHKPEDEKRLVLGRGKWMTPEKGWEPLATGEFILGHPDESQELPPTAPPDEFTRNGSFLVYRKLHENVSSFRKYLADQAKIFAQIMSVSEDEAKDTLGAKMIGRWHDGIPLSKAPTYEAWQATRKKWNMSGGSRKDDFLGMLDYRGSSDISDFKFGDDIRGYKCPNGAHLRRTNTRDYLDPLNQPDSDNPNATTQLNKRRRILRRGLPYGEPRLGAGTDDTDQGVNFMVVCANIFRQFEFVQQQWIQYGLDFNQGNNTCPILGNHSIHKRHTIPVDPATGKPPYICDNLPQFVETRGGDYFFIPSMTALRMMAMGIVDPT